MLYIYANLEPQCYLEAKYQLWIDSVREEDEALLRNDTWELVPLEDDMKVIGNR